MNRQYMLQKIKETLEEASSRLTRRQLESEYQKMMMLGMNGLSDEKLKKQFDMYFEYANNKKDREISH